MDMGDILYALSITLLMEPLLVSAFFKMDKKAFIISFISNLILNPSMNLALGYIDPDFYYMSLTLFEIMTVIIETLILILLGRKPIMKSLLAVFTANLASFLVGFGLNRIGFDYHVQFVLTMVLLASEVIALSVYLALAFLDVANKEHPSDDRPGQGQR